LWTLAGKLKKKTGVHAPKKKLRKRGTCDTLYPRENAREKGQKNIKKKGDILRGDDTKKK